MKVLIMGCGRVGSALATALDQSGHQVTVMDLNEAQFQRLAHDFRGTSMVGNCLDPDALKRAGIEEMDAFIAVTQGDNRNLMAAQIAKHVFSVPRVISRVYDPIRGEIYQGQGLVMVSSTIIMSQLIKERLEQMG